MQTTSLLTSLGPVTRKASATPRTFQPARPYPRPLRVVLLSLGLAACFHPTRPLTADSSTFTIASYNLENYLLQPAAGRLVKRDDAKREIRTALRQIQPDILALQEVGGTNALYELQRALHNDGFDLPYREWVGGFDTNIQVALLSRFPILARRSHPDESFLLHGRRFRTSRGFLEADVEPAPGYRLTLFSAHLKSRRQSTAAAQDEIREEEARLLRRLIDARLQSNPELNLVVLGDFNDLKDSPPLRILLGKGRQALVDLRPAEPNSGSALRQSTWTYFYAKEDAYARVDYILVSRGLARELDRSGVYVHAWPHWGLASDHRPVVARFRTPDR